jgi:hypothetical protein
MSGSFKHVIVDTDHINLLRECIRARLRELDHIQDISGGACSKAMSYAAFTQISELVTIQDELDNALKRR